MVSPSGNGVSTRLQSLLASNAANTYPPDLASSVRRGVGREQGSTYEVVPELITDLSAGYQGAFVAETIVTSDRSSLCLS